ncbi:MAG: DNA polymerase III subunit gamma/tau [Defluviitaleaceae bacterium]|nr:DNA polymerase III subunit gamma/tau [Defluviitaleaceae bacterium]
MSYTALYRKLRPQNFESIVDQTHIVRILKNQLESGRISHAYLFCGTRGTGKTTTAKIFAKALNCLNPIGIEPCDKCDSCLSILNGSSLNVIEIDAASNNGVDNIREIREEVKYPPTNAKYKIYIIDEVHMLSTGAFNALLKTLEEPPKHVIFILATTDPQKIPATIHSRCQRLDFKRITQESMVNALKKYMVEENVETEEDAFRYIATLSDGAMRDALSLLDQCISFYPNEKITLENVLNITGSVDNSVFFDFADALCGFDSANCLDIINKIVIDGRDLNQFLQEFILHLRNVLVAKSAGYMVLDFSEENGKKYEEQGKKIDKDMLIDYISTFSELQNKIKYSFNERVVLETCCIGLCNPSRLSNSSNSELTARILKLESMINSGKNVVYENAPAKKEKKTVQPTKPKAVPDDINNVISTWQDFANSLKLPTKALLSKAFAGFLDGDILYIVATSSTNLTLIKNRETEILETLSKFYDKEFTVSFILKETYDLNHKDAYGVLDENSINEAEIIDKLGDFVDFE